MNAQSLKDSLTRWTGFPKIERTFEPRRTRGAATRVTKLLMDVQPRVPAPFDLKTLHLRVMEAWRRDHSLERIDHRDLRQLPWILFYPPRHDDRARHRGPTGWLGARPRIVQEYRHWLSDGRRTRSVLALLHEFLRVYPVDLPTFDDLRRLLQGAVEAGASPPLPSLRKWRQRCRDFGLLGTDGGWSFVQKLVSTAGAPDEALGLAGLDAGLARCGFLESGIRKYLPNAGVLLAENRLDVARLERLLAVLECEGKLRFDARVSRVEIATALLRPFVDRAPEQETKERLQSFFLRHFGDPRLRSGRNKWSGVPDEIRHVVIEWLVKEALEEFFLLIKETALDEHWRYREAFWKAFLRQKSIEKAWFILGPRASRLSKSQSKEQESTTGMLSGAQSDQSVLLLRMPGMTIAEWSHNGSCRIWLDGNPDVPAFYKSSYSRYALMRGADFSQRHVYSEYGRWQDRIARWMHENTGVDIDRGEYILRDAFR